MPWHFLAPHSASAQFFINVKDNTFLDYPGQDGWGYCVFGKVVEGMDVVNAIKEVDTNHAGHSDVPVEPVVVEQQQWLVNEVIICLWRNLSLPSLNKNTCKVNS